MNTIYNNSTNTNILNNTQNTVTSVNNNQISKENSNSTSTSTKTDSIEISQKDTNKINAKKATDALDEVASGFPEGSHIKLEFFVMGQMMKHEGYDVPSFNFEDNTSPTEFLSYLKNMKGFVKNSNIMRDGAPMDKSEFYDFCDLYTEKLKQYGFK